jgi:hypothetical protein
MPECQLPAKIFHSYCGYFNCIGCYALIDAKTREKNQWGEKATARTKIVPVYKSNQMQLGLPSKTNECLLEQN